MTTEQHTYTFGEQSNSYFNGRDTSVTRDDGKSVLVNVKDGMMAVEVKDRAGWWSYPDDIKSMADELGESTIERLYDQLRDDYWRWATDFLVNDYDEVTDIYSAGRSSGWLCVRGISPDAVVEDKELMHTFLALAFDASEAVDGQREMFYESIREEFSELESARESAIVRGEN